MPLTFVSESQWCRWHRAVGIMIGMEIKQHREAKYKNTNWFHTHKESSRRIRMDELPAPVST